VTTQDVPVLQLTDEPPVRPKLLRSDPLIVGGLVLLAFALRVPMLGRAYWVDEGISVGIASHPLSQIPQLLREDGSPPLFYFILHFWMRIFGTSPVATHVLPLIISLGCVPLGYWAGTRLFDRRAGILAAALFATSPFLNWYATETRMYPLVVALSILGLTLAWQAVRDRSWLSGVGAVLAYAGLLYTHDWGIYLTAVTALVLFGLALSTGDRRMAVAIALATGAAFALWAPWLTAFLAQAQNTAAPWAVRPEIGDFFADPSSALGGTVGVIVVPAVVVAAYWTRRQRPIPDAHLAGLLGAIGIITVVAGFVGAQIEPSWTVRYLAVIVAPMLLATAGALAPSRTGRVAVVGVCVLLVGWSAIGSLLPNPNSRFAKSNVAAVAAAVASRLQPGDLVVVTQTEQVPVLAHYLPAGIQYATPTGAVPDPYVVDWRHIVHRLQVAQPCSTLAPEINALPVGAGVLVVNPGKKLGASGSAWSKAVNAQVLAVNDMIIGSRSLQPAGVYDQAIKPAPFSPVTAELFRKTNRLAACA
jgi:4-amino-4-deoxy-L-arabinose transferase-like glycosyltransferase